MLEDVTRILKRVKAVGLTPERETEGGTETLEGTEIVEGAKESISPTIGTRRPIELIELIDPVDMTKVPNDGATVTSEGTGPALEERRATLLKRLSDAIARFRTDNELSTVGDVEDMKQRFNLLSFETVKEFEDIMRRNWQDRKLNIGSSTNLQFPLGVASTLPSSTLLFKIFHDSDVKGLEDVLDPFCRIISDCGAPEEKYKYLFFVKLAPKTVVISVVHVDMDPSSRKLTVSFYNRRCCIVPEGEMFQPI